MMENGARVDYPEEGEIIRFPSYTIRVDAPAETHAVEVRLNGGSWQPCRKAAGFWWCDWSEFGPGDYLLEVSTRGAEGPFQAGPTRRFKVDLGLTD